MPSRKADMLVGFFIAAAIAALIVLALNVSRMNVNSESVSSWSGDGGKHYLIMARFDNIGGLKVHSPVSASGVTIGEVTQIQYSNETYEAIVSMAIDLQYNKFPVDTAASILTIGFVGKQFVGLDPGAEENYLKAGDTIGLTQSALVLEQIIGQFLYNQANDNK